MAINGNSLIACLFRIVGNGLQTLISSSVICPLTLSIPTLSFIFDADQNEDYPGLFVAASNGGISAPSLKGSNEDYSGLFGAASGGGSNKGGKGSRIGTGKHGGLGGGRTTAEAMATGGTRNTSINISIAKFFDNINVTMADKTDTAELENIVVQTMNRALAIAVSTDH